MSEIDNIIWQLGTAQITDKQKLHIQSALKLQESLKLFIKSRQELNELLNHGRDRDDINDELKPLLVLIKDSEK